MKSKAPPWALLAAIAAGVVYFVWSRPAAAASSSTSAVVGAAASGDDFGALSIGAPLAFEGSGAAPSKLQKLDFGFLAAIAANVQKLRNQPGGMGAGLELAPGLAPAGPAAGAGYTGGAAGGGGGGGGSRAGPYRTQIF